MEEEQWEVIKAQNKWYEWNIREVWEYRDLIVLFVKRNFIVSYKQTILGPLWIILNPLLTGMVFSVVFGNLVKVTTDGIPQLLFYVSGNILWGFFAKCFGNGAGTFASNLGLYSKVYFPRLIIPISYIVTNLINFMIQFLMLAMIGGYCAFNGIAGFHFGISMLGLPLLLVQTALLSTGMGLILSALTVKYKDLMSVIGFGLQLWMYITPVVYPASILPDSIFSVMMLNPMAAIMETFRSVLFGKTPIPYSYLWISIALTGAVTVLGIILFKRAERTFVDVI